MKKSFNETKNAKHDTRNEKINKKDSKVDSSVVFIFPQNKFGIFQQLRSFFVPLPIFGNCFFSLSHGSSSIIWERLKQTRYRERGTCSKSELAS